MHYYLYPLCLFLDKQEVNDALGHTKEMTPTDTLRDFTRRQCVDYNLTTNLNTSKLVHHMVDHGHQVAYCVVPKVASSSWFLMFAYLSGKVRIKLTNQEDNSFHAWEKKSQKKLGFEYLSNLSKNRSLEILHNYYKFLFVREPYYRLVSAYRDKFRPGHDRRYYHDRYGRDIIRTYRRDPSRESLRKGNDVTFPEFIKFVIDSATTNTLDNHWKPIYEMCHPCDIHYDLVGRMENFAKDTTVVLREGFNNTSGLKFPENPGGHKTTGDIVKEFYSVIPRGDIEEIRRIFRYDFLLFGYPDILPL